MQGVLRRLRTRPTLQNRPEVPSREYPAMRLGPQVALAGASGWYNARPNPARLRSLSGRLNQNFVSGSCPGPSTFVLDWTMVSPDRTISQYPVRTLL